MAWLFHILLWFILASSGFADSSASLPQSIEIAKRILQQKSASFFEDVMSAIDKIFLITQSQIQHAQGKINVSSAVIGQLKVFDSILGLNTDLFLSTMEQIDSTNSFIKLKPSLAVIASVEKKRQDFIYAQPGHNQKKLSKIFEDSYNSHMALLSDALFTMMHDEYKKGDTVFDKIASLTHKHPSRIFHFARGCVQLLLRAIVLEGAHVQLVFESSEGALQTFRRRSKERFQTVVVKAATVYKDSIDSFPHQMVEDHKRMQEDFQELSHCEFASHVVNYFEEKYPEYEFMAVAYDPMDSDKDHALTVCSGSELIKFHGRNSGVTYVHRSQIKDNFAPWAQSVLESVSDQQTRDHYAQTMLNALADKMSQPWCSRHKMAVVVTDNGNSCAVARPGHFASVIRHTWKCNPKWPCWGKKKYYFELMLLG